MTLVARAESKSVDIATKRAVMSSCAFRNCIRRSPHESVPRQNYTNVLTMFRLIPWRSRLGRSGAERTGAVQQDSQRVVR